jgi:hypothetical protein
VAAEKQVKETGVDIKEVFRKYDVQQVLSTGLKEVYTPDFINDLVNVEVEARKAGREEAAKLLEKYKNENRLKPWHSSVPWAVGEREKIQELADFIRGFFKRIDECDVSFKEYPLGLWYCHEHMCGPGDEACGGEKCPHCKEGTT